MMWLLKRFSSSPFISGPLNALVIWSNQIRRQIAIRIIENDPETRAVGVWLRSCRFSDENYLEVHRFYSFSACLVECRKRQQLRVCNCTNHFMPNTRKSHGFGQKWRRMRFDIVLNFQLKNYIATSTDWSVWTTTTRSCLSLFHIGHTEGREWFVRIVCHPAPRWIFPWSMIQERSKEMLNSNILKHILFNSLAGLEKILNVPLQLWRLVQLPQKSGTKEMLFVVD